MNNVTDFERLQLKKSIEKDFDAILASARQRSEERLIRNGFIVLGVFTLGVIVGSRGKK